MSLNGYKGLILLPEIYKVFANYLNVNFIMINFWEYTGVIYTTWATCGSQLLVKKHASTSF